MLILDSDSTGLTLRYCGPHESHIHQPGRSASSSAETPNGRQSVRRTSNRPGAPEAGPITAPSDRSLPLWDNCHTGPDTIQKHSRACRTGPTDSAFSDQLDVSFYLSCRDTMRNHSIGCDHLQNYKPCLFPPGTRTPTPLLLVDDTHIQTLSPQATPKVSGRTRPHHSS